MTVVLGALLSVPLAYLLLVRTWWKLRSFGLNPWNVAWRCLLRMPLIDWTKVPDAETK